MTALMLAVEEALAKAGLLHADARLLCALSGGADSVALLLSLARAREAHGFEVRAVHVQHHLRGESSLADERFVHALCERLRVPLAVEELSLEATMDDPGIETLARDARRTVFLRQMARMNAQALLLAHHRDDQAETVLMHLLRGSGMRGLCGMQACAPFGGGVLLRPFLQIPKQALLDALSAEGAAHCEDESNEKPSNPRNALRLQVLPRLEALYPAAGAHIAQAAALLAAEDDCLEQQANALYEQAAYCVPPIAALRLDALQAAHPALKRRALRRMWQTLGVESSLSQEDTLQLEALLAAPAGTVHNLPHGWRAEVQRAYLHFAHEAAPPYAEAAQPIAKARAEYRFAHACINQTAAGSECPASPAEAVLTPEILALHPVLRLPQSGDRIHPLGASGEKPLRRYLTDQKMDPFLRPCRPVLAVGSEVLWVPCYCISERLRIAAPPPDSIRLTCIDQRSDHHGK